MDSGHVLYLAKVLSAFYVWPECRHCSHPVLLRHVNDIREAADRGEVCLLVLLDPRAAFDIIDHARLLERLRLRRGVSESAMAWFKCFLPDRFQSVKN